MKRILLVSLIALPALSSTYAWGVESAAQPPKGAGVVPALQVAHAERGLLLDVAQAGNHVIAVGGFGSILQSTDGANWKQINSPVDVALTSIRFADERNGWAVGHDAVILHTTDGGATWKLQSREPDLYSPLFSIEVINSNQAIAVGAFGTIKQTKDAGATWTDVMAPAISDDKLHLNAITKLNGGSFAVAGERGLLGWSADGVAWKRVESPYEGSFFGIVPWGDKGAIAYGMRGNVYVATDASTGPWKKIETGTTSSFFGSQLLPTGALMLMGSDGHVAILSKDLSVSRWPAKTEKSPSGTVTGGTVLAGKVVLVGDVGAYSATLR
ncbi:WD40/YVTN/BNR-like repeat-containing protein [Hydrocarboniphaga sp.]|uniref:WD40/YVTN/BNR-like repeat-containing protein n=2 Tax=Hydrocarboniphaga TaxID=243627 RepID=UPI002ABBCC90|nr:YCF48-related protein [Hydrocarboniphaga sp.]MDZ4078619.1 YCF48-related protein [Hydrocarboniphaga sp.]